mmetsp:Transcript_24458/g.68558  ORF Transcript_24458/g.68558 Transcript_24458/m.68558 type:complete len:132 (-) Transcript_24458:258-653(-)
MGLYHGVENFSSEEDLQLSSSSLHLYAGRESEAEVEAERFVAKKETSEVPYFALCFVLDELRMRDGRQVGWNRHPPLASPIPFSCSPLFHPSGQIRHGLSPPVPTLLLLPHYPTKLNWAPRRLLSPLYLYL